MMNSALASQIVTAAATLAGVILTLVTNAFLERRRARDNRVLEQIKLGAERAKWLREARQKTYSDLSSAGENALQFVRNELPRVLSGQQTAEVAEAQWIELRTALRQAFNELALVAPPNVCATAREVWRAARNTGNDFFAQWHASTEDAVANGPLLSVDGIRGAIGDMGRVGNQNLDACRADLSGD